MFEAWDEGAPEHVDQEAEQDRVSFDDSDRFEEDSICSYLSEAESCNNWQGWKKAVAATNGAVSSPLPLKPGQPAISGKGGIGQRFIRLID